MSFINYVTLTLSGTLQFNLSPFHNVNVIHIDAFEIPVYQKHDCQTYRGFCRGNSYDEYGEYLPHQSGGGDEFRESYKIDIDCIEHQLDGHQNADSISSG